MRQGLKVGMFGRILIAMIVLLLAVVAVEQILMVSGVATAVKVHAGLKVADAVLDAKKDRVRAARARGDAARQIREDEIVFEDEASPG